MTVLFSELLIPGWAQGPTAKIGLGDVTWAYEDAPVISYTDHASNKSKGDYKRADNPFVPTITEPAKMSSLPCHSADPELFFSEEVSMISQAKALCGSCPMQAKCLEGALSRAEPCGVWGGELFDEGQVIQSKRLPGRPAKIAVAS